MKRTLIPRTRRRCSQRRIPVSRTRKASRNAKISLIDVESRIQKINIYRGGDGREIRESSFPLSSARPPVDRGPDTTVSRSRCSLCESLEHHGCVLGPWRSLEFAATSSRRRLSNRDKGKKEQSVPNLARVHTRAADSLRPAAR